ncbi:MAG: hypothetical protein B6U69_02225 [Thermofilum sp. ex4484_15]|nr:MAG: hypothetical protein B6U69_02225 [Thermofilum sp. ex4484_15]
MDIKEEICLVMKLLYERGLIPSLGGNVSSKVGNYLWITPSSKFKANLTPEDLVKLSLDGKIIQGSKPSREWRMHVAIYRSRVDIYSIVHAHNPLTVGLYSSQGLEGMIMEFLKGLTKVSIVPELPAGSKELASAVAEASKEADLIILRGHGIVSLGKSPLEALNKVEVLEMASLSALTSSIAKAMSWIHRLMGWGKG